MDVSVHIHWRITPWRIPPPPEYSGPCVRHEAIRRNGLEHHTFLTSAPDARKCSASSSSHFTPRKKALGTYCKVGWVGRESKKIPLI